MIPGLVSVIVPCYNSALYIDDAIRSARNQTYAMIEIIVVDDGSTDDSLLRIERQADLDARIRVVAQPNKGPSAARNAGMRQVRGEFVCFLDSDDFLLSDKVEKQVGFLRRNPGSDFVYSDYLVGDERLNLTGFVATRIPESNMMAAYARRQWFGPMAPLFRASVIDRVGTFDESLRAAEEWDYWIRCAQKVAFSYLPGACAVYRRHPSELHLDVERMFENGRCVIEKNFRSDKELYGLALSCFYWTQAKREFRMHRFSKLALCLAASQYYSFLAGGVPLRYRDADTTILPVPSEAREAFWLSTHRNSEPISDYAT